MLTAPSPTCALTEVGGAGTGAGDATVEPGVTPAATSACADRLDPDPSMLPTFGVLASVIPTLSYAPERSSGVVPTVIAKTCSAGPDDVGGLTFGSTTCATVLLGSSCTPA